MMRLIHHTHLDINKVTQIIFLYYFIYLFSRRLKLTTRTVTVAARLTCHTALTAAVTSSQETRIVKVHMVSSPLTTFVNPAQYVLSFYSHRDVNCCPNSHLKLEKKSVYMKKTTQNLLIMVDQTN